MKISSHLIEIQNVTLKSLSENKKELIRGILSVTEKTANLLKTDSYDFWLNQLAKIKWNEIPTTIHAIRGEKMIWEQLKPTREAVIGTLGHSLERILTYWEEDDLCEMQGQFFYFKVINTNQVFCESEFGKIRGFENPKETGEIEIATITDLRSRGIINEKNKWQIFQN